MRNRLSPAPSVALILKSSGSDVATNTGEGRTWVLLLNGSGERARLRLTAALETRAGRRVRSVPVVPIATEASRIAMIAPVPLADDRGDYVLNIEARTTRHTVNRRIPFSVE